MPPHSRVAKQVLRTATGRRTGGHSSGTKKALVTAAAGLFSERGYAGTSLDEVVAAARVTKGALYHHFSSKLELFESVYLDVQSACADEIERAIGAVRDPWEKAEIGMQTFLEVCRRPDYRRICMQEGPVALGHERWQEVERATTLGIVRGIVDGLMHDLDAPDRLTDVFTAVFYGSIRSASEYVADSDDLDAASDDVLLTLGIVLAGLRSLPDANAE